MADISDFLTTTAEETPKRRYTEGSKNAKVILIGEALGEDEIRYGKPFQGYSGQELTKMLGEAGLNRDDCFLTNVVHERSPWKYFYKVGEAKKKGIERVDGRYPRANVLAGRNALREELSSMSPNLIIPLGDVAFWAVTGKTDGITKWRGSVLETEFGKVLPTFNPAAVMRNWPSRWFSVADFRRAAREQHYPEVQKPKWNFTIRPTLDQALELLDSIKGKTVAADIEGYSGDMSCVGFATSALDAFCIPLTTPENVEGYWSADDELKITLKLKEILTDPTTHIIWQNGQYDLECFVDQYGYLPNISDDIMLMTHTCFPGMKKSLDTQASLFCDYYSYWKDNNKTWRDSGNIEQHWLYNCEDVVRTFECWEALTDCVKSYGLEEQYQEQLGLVLPVLRMMFRGFKVNMKNRMRISGELLKASVERHEWLEKVLGHPLNPDSPKQMKELFYEDFKMKVIKKRDKYGVMQPTCNDDALETIAKRQPLLKPLTEVIQEIRSIGVFRSTFVEAEVDSDQHLRYSMNLTGAETFRFSCSKNIRGSGCNMQTIPKGTEDD